MSLHAQFTPHLPIWRCKLVGLTDQLFLIHSIQTWQPSSAFSPLTHLALLGWHFSASSLVSYTMHIDGWFPGQMLKINTNTYQTCLSYFSFTMHSFTLGTTSTKKIVLNGHCPFGGEGGSTPARLIWSLFLLSNCA